MAKKAVETPVEETENKTKANRMRSPNFPIIDLEKAVERTGAVHEKFKTFSTPIAEVQKLWKYKPGSSIADQTVAALRSYGLVEVSGSGDKRQIKVSDRGRRIVLNASDRAELLKECAKSPSINQELLQMATAEGLPPNETIRHYLTFDRPEAKFNEDAVDGVIERFRATIQFAKLDQSDIMRKGKGNNADRDDDSSDDPKKDRYVAKGILPLPLLMPDGTIAVIDIPRMTEETFKFFKAQLDTYRAAIVIKKSDAESIEEN